MKVIGPLLMEILHFEDLWDTKILSMNVVWVHVNLVELRSVISWEHNFFQFFWHPGKHHLVLGPAWPKIHVNFCIQILKTTATLYIKLFSTSWATKFFFYLLPIWVVHVIWLKSSTSNLAKNAVHNRLLVRVIF